MKREKKNSKEDFFFKKKSLLHFYINTCPFQPNQNNTNKP